MKLVIRTIIPMNTPLFGCVFLLSLRSQHIPTHDLANEIRRMNNEVAGTLVPRHALLKARASLLEQLFERQPEAVVALTLSRHLLTAIRSAHPEWDALLETQG